MPIYNMMQYSIVKMADQLVLEEDCFQDMTTCPCVLLYFLQLNVMQSAQHVL